MASERMTAMFLVTATGRQSSVVVGATSAAEALAKTRQLRADGLATVVFDRDGIECSMDRLRTSLAPARDRQ